MKTLLAYQKIVDPMLDAQIFWATMVILILATIFRLELMIKV